MKKLKKLLPVLILLLIAWYFLRPSGTVQTPVPAAAEPTQQLTLLPSVDPGSPAAEHMAIEAMTVITSSTNINSTDHSECRKSQE